MFFEGGPLTHGSWWGNIVNRKPPRGGGVLSIKMDVHKFMYGRTYIYIRLAMTKGYKWMCMNLCHGYKWMCIHLCMDVQTFIYVLQSQIVTNGCTCIYAWMYIYVYTSCNHKWSQMDANTSISWSQMDVHSSIYDAHESICNIIDYKWM